MTTEVLEQPPAPPAPTSNRLRMAVLIGVLIAVIGGGFATAKAFIERSLPEEYTNAKVITLEQLESDYGIHLDLVGVIAAGGMVDLEFSVTDADKAKKVFTDETIHPAVFSETDKLLLFSSHMRHHQVEVQDGGSYFVIFGNRSGTVQRGTPVSVIFNSVRVDHVVAQS
jgi:hypothetical protein